MPEPSWYKDVPGLPLSVRDNGMVIVTETKQVLLSTIEKRGKKLLRRIRWDGELYYVHRLVALTWVDHPADAGDSVRFKDGNSLNVDASNLYWSKRGPKKGRKSV
jgi:hypothetical protein